MSNSRQFISLGDLDIIEAGDFIDCGCPRCPEIIKDTNAYVGLRAGDYTRYGTRFLRATNIGSLKTLDEEFADVY